MFDDETPEHNAYKGCDGTDVIAFIRINLGKNPREAAILTRLKQDKRLNREFRKFLLKMDGQQELPF